MCIQRLDIKNFRIINHVTINPSRGLNILFGANAGGKTSVLEAIDCLSRGRSFRSQKSSDLIANGQSPLWVSGYLAEKQGRQIYLSMEKTATATLMRMQGRLLNSVSTTAATLPVQIIHSNSFDLIQGLPKQRRAFIDWGVFHVEHDFLYFWRRYQRALRQRNSLLRQRNPLKTVFSWHEELTSVAAYVDAQRRIYLDRLAPFVHEFTRILFDDPKTVTLQYNRGWPLKHELGSLLQQNIANDVRKGFTTLGPHIADLKIKMGDKLASRIASRGQQKLLVAALRMAQINLHTQLSNRPCVFLIDDLPSELDVNNRKRFMNGLKKLKIQIFLTSVDKDSVETSDWQETKLFHVKQGTIIDSIPV